MLVKGEGMVLKICFIYVKFIMKYIDVVMCIWILSKCSEGEINLGGVFD